MFTHPFSTLMHYKRWATNGLNTVVADSFGRMPADEQVLVLRLLDHIQTVDEIFSHNLEARPHGHQAPRSVELPSLEDLASKARSMADWYADYADALEPDEIDEVLAFSFSNGEPTSMTRGEVLCTSRRTPRAIAARSRSCYKRTASSPFRTASRTS